MRLMALITVLIAPSWAVAEKYDPFKTVSAAGAFAKVIIMRDYLKLTPCNYIPIKDESPKITVEFILSKLLDSLQSQDRSNLEKVWKDMEQEMHSKAQQNFNTYFEMFSAKVDEKTACGLTFGSLIADIRDREEAFYSALKEFGN